MHLLKTFLKLSESFKIFNDIDSLKPNGGKINDQKENCFALSACLNTEKTRKNPFMWEKYGNKGKGVIIQFKINYDEIFKFLLGKSCAPISDRVPSSTWHLPYQPETKFSLVYDPTLTVSHLCWCHHRHP